MPTVTRANKITVIGGKIGEETFSQLNQQGAANEIVLHRRPQKEEADNRRIQAFVRAVNEANGIRADGVSGVTDRYFVENGLATKARWETDPAEALRGAKIVIMAAGLPRKSKTQPRAELLGVNAPIIDTIAELTAQYAPDATVVVVSNPVDPLTQRFQEISALPHNRVIGFGSEVDTSRLKKRLSENLNLHPGLFTGAKVLGEHGPTMVPLYSHIEIPPEGILSGHVDSGKFRSFADLFATPQACQDMKDKVTAETAASGGWYAGMINTTDHIGPGAGITKIVETILRGGPNNTIIASAYDKRNDVYYGQEINFADGAYTVKPTRLTQSERDMLNISIASCQAARDELPGRKQLRSALSI